MRSSRYFLLWVILLAYLMTACSGNQAVEGLFSADEKLKEKSSSPTNNSAPINTSTAIEFDLPQDFPTNLPLYRQAKLIKKEKDKTFWQSEESQGDIISYYRQELPLNNWQILSDKLDDSQNKTLRASRDEIKVTISFIDANPLTEFIIEYQNDTSKLPTNSTNTTIQPVTNISDWEKVPELYRPYLEDLIALGIVPTKDDLLQPEAIITRREFARWLVTANNRFYINQPGKQIRLASQNVTPAFNDVDKNDPDFAVIQGLAETGLIPSSLSGDNSALLFRPDTPLTREDLILWKVPLDLRKSLPDASIDTVKQTWGFQDTSTIDPKIWRSLVADFQNGDRSNISRVFGYTTLFQPKKPVTRAEAATALWYFGYQGEGITAQDALKLTSNK